MAQKFQFLTRNCLEWTTDKPFCDSPRQSPSFKYLGCNWYFHFILSVQYNPNAKRYVNTYILSIRSNDNKSLDINYVIKLFLTVSTKATCQASASTVSSQAETNLLKYSGFRSEKDEGNGLWTLHCIFLADGGSDLHINGSETMHVSNLPDSIRPCNSTPSRIFARAKLAASAPRDSPSGLENLSLDFSKLLEDKSSSDVTITCGDRTLYAHKLILTARSEVFAGMFQSRMVESKRGSINIIDTDGEVFELLLTYVYTGKISSMTVDIATRLYIAADKYCILSLKHECSKWILGSLTKDNCLDFLALADMCTDTELKDRLINFTAEILVLLEGDKWIEFSNKYPQLALNVYHRRAFFTNQV